MLSLTSVCFSRGADKNLHFCCHRLSWNLKCRATIQRIGATEGSRCLGTTIGDEGPNVVEGRSDLRSEWAMLYIPFAWGTNESHQVGGRQSQYFSISLHCHKHLTSSASKASTYSSCISARLDLDLIQIILLSTIDNYMSSPSPPQPFPSPIDLLRKENSQPCLSSSSRNIPLHPQANGPNMKRPGPTWSVDQAVAPSFAEQAAPEHPARNHDCLSRITITGTTIIAPLPIQSSSLAHPAPTVPNHQQLHLQHPNIPPQPQIPRLPQPQPRPLAPAPNSSPPSRQMRKECGMPTKPNGRGR